MSAGLTQADLPPARSPPSFATLLLRVSLGIRNRNPKTETSTRVGVPEIVPVLPPRTTPAGSFTRRRRKTVRRCTARHRQRCVVTRTHVPAGSALATLKLPSELLVGVVLLLEAVGRTPHALNKQNPAQDDNHARALEKIVPVKIAAAGKFFSRQKG